MPILVFLLLAIMTAKLVPPLEEALKNCLTGQRSGVNDFVKQAVPVLRRAIYQRLRKGGRSSQQDADDVLQQTYLVLFRDKAKLLKAFNGQKGSLSSYLSTIATRAAQDYLDRIYAQKRGSGVGEVLVESQHPAMAGAVQTAPNPEVHLSDAQSLQALESRLLEQLSDKGRLFYRLIYVEELSIGEIEAGLGINRDVVYTWRKRIKQTLSGLLDADKSSPALEL